MDHPKEKYGPKSTVHDRLKDWEKLGVWKRIMDAIISSGYVQGKLSIDKVAIDCTDVVAKKGGEAIGYDGGVAPPFSTCFFGVKVHSFFSSSLIFIIQF